MSSRRRIEGVVADLEQPAARARSCDVLWSNLRCNLSMICRPVCRVESRPEGGWRRDVHRAGPDTMIELRRAINLAGDDAARRVRQFTDLHDIGDMLVHAPVSPIR